MNYIAVKPFDINTFIRFFRFQLAIELKQTNRKNHNKAANNKPSISFV